MVKETLVFETNHIDLCLGMRQLWSIGLVLASRLGGNLQLMATDVWRGISKVTTGAVCTIDGAGNNQHCDGGTIGDVCRQNTARRQ